MPRTLIYELGMRREELEPGTRTAARERRHDIASTRRESEAAEHLLSQPF